MIKQVRFSELSIGTAFHYLHHAWVKVGAGWGEDAMGAIVQMRGHEIVETDVPDDEAQEFPAGAYTAKIELIKPWVDQGDVDWFGFSGDPTDGG